MAKQIDLRTRPRVPAPKPGDGPLPAGNGPPLPAGVPLTKFERDGMARLGLATDGPPPPGLADEIHRLRAEKPDLFEPRLPDGVPADHRLRPPAEVPFETLPADHRAQIQDFARRAAADRDLTRRIADAAVPEAGPGVNAAIAAAVRAGDRVIPVVNDLPGRPAPADQVAAPRPADPPPTQAGADLPRRHCPHCGWDHDKADPIEVDDADKAAYLASVLGGQRFRKEVALFGGRLKVGFRTLTSVERDLAFRQTVVDGSQDLQKKVAPDDQELWGNLVAYMLAMGLDYLEDAANGRREVPTLDEAEVDPAAAPNTRLRPYYEAVIRAYLPTDQVRRVVGDAYHLFNHTVEKMDVRATDPDFWRAIGG